MSRTLFCAGFGVFGVDGETDGDFERRGISHATLFAFGLIVFQLQADRVAALITEGNDVAVERAAMVAENVAGMKRIGLDGRAARRVPAGGTKVMQPFQIAALALPVADRIIDELQLTDAAEIGNREDGSKDRLQSDIVALIRQKIHLQELLVRILLDFDQIRNRNRSFDFGKINSIGGQTVLRHRIQELRYRRQAPLSRRRYLETKTAENKAERISLDKNRPPNIKHVLRAHNGAQDWMLGNLRECGEQKIGAAITDADTRRCVDARRTKPPREGMTGLQLKCQGSSATVTNPGLIPVDTNANLRG